MKKLFTVIFASLFLLGTFGVEFAFAKTTKKKATAAKVVKQATKATKKEVAKKK